MAHLRKIAVNSLEKGWIKRHLYKNTYSFLLVILEFFHSKFKFELIYNTIDMFRLFAFITAIGFAFSANAQVRLENASFEGESQDATTPMNWHPCEMGTTPDILPGEFGVTLEASEGETYMGLITRDDGTYESVGQRLFKPMEGEECYSIKVDLACSPNYASHNKAIQLRIWGAETKCSKDQLLVESIIIDHNEWESYDFKFSTKMSFNYVIFEAYYAPKEGEIGRKGNILVDNISQIKPCRRASL